MNTYCDLKTDQPRKLIVCNPLAYLEHRELPELPWTQEKLLIYIVSKHYYILRFMSSANHRVDEKLAQYALCNFTPLNTYWASLVSIEASLPNTEV